MRLKYKTRGMSDPKGKPKVYFSCHPEDYKEAFPLISDDLLKHANCAVWYDEELAGLPDVQMTEKSGIPAEEETAAADPEEILKEMQLVVFGVTSKFIHEENHAKDVELPLALKNHIPVLPIMLENGIRYEFSNNCAKIQVVTKYGTDSTAIPYEEVLQTFLDSVLVGDELAEKVREAFDAYVFLSYRKKDRRHAQRLMRLIHENRQFRDIAIWYDEFLVPGEGFNEAIKDAFRKSSLFAMAVTPHLEEKGNYVMRVEYPMARDRRCESDDFEIVPVEMYEPEDGEIGKDWRIDQSRLKGQEDFKYQEITDLEDEHRALEMNRSFLDALSRIAKKENDGSARHRFFIGLAYLSGIDVEINQERAMALLKSAAMDPNPCMEATAKLADMYLTGDGVPADRREALNWQNMVVEQYNKAYEEMHDPDEHKGYGTQYFKALLKLSDMQRDSGDIYAAAGSAKQALAFVEKLEEEVGVREMERDLALVSNRLGGMCREIGDLASARTYYEKACTIYEKLSFQIGTARARRDLSISYERLGDLCRKTGKLPEADDYYKKALELRRKLNEGAGTPATRRDLSAILTKLGNIRKSGRDYAGAGKYYEEALAMDKVLAAEMKTPQAGDDFGVSLVKSGDIHKAEGRLDDAEKCYREAAGIFRVNTQKTGSRFFKDHQAGGCEKLASIQKKRGEMTEAAELYGESVTLREQLYEQDKTVSCANALAAAYFNAAVFFDDKAMMKKAYLLWKELSDTHPEYKKYRDRAEQLSG